VSNKRSHPARQPTLKDIAGATSLTVATVSRILAGKTNFAPETRERVEAVAHAMGYRPNRLVSGIQTGRTGIIGVIAPIHAEWGARLVTGLQQELAPKGYVPIVLDCPSPSMNEQEMIYHLLDRRVEGVVLFPGDDTVSDEYFDELHSRKIPLVVLNRRLERAHCYLVGGDDRGSGKLAAKHLLELGHRVLGHLAGPPQISTGRERAEGFIHTAMLKKGVSVAQAVMPTFLPDEKLIEEFLTNHPAVSGIYCANESIALGLYAAAKRIGLRIPEDLSVVSHGNFRTSAYVTPALTSLREECELIGKEAVKALLDLINHPESPKALAEKRVVTSLVIRESTAKPRAIAPGKIGSPVS
jgi:LacI family transcriptional regulator